MAVGAGMKPVGTPREEWQRYNNEFYDPRSGQKIVFTKVNGKSVPVIYTGPSEEIDGGGSRSISKWTGTRNFGEGYKEKELEAGQIAEDHREGAGFPGQRPSGSTPPAAPAPTSPPAPAPAPQGSGGSSTKTSPTGLKQTGKTLGGLEGINLLLSGLTRRDGSNAGISLADTVGMYDSEALPTTPGASRQLDGRPQGEGGKSSGNYTVIKPDDPIFAKAFGQDLADKYTKTTNRRGGQKDSGFASSDGPVDREAPSVAGTIQEEDGAAEKSAGDADQSRQIQQTKPWRGGARQSEFRGRQNPRGNFGGEEPDDASLVSPMYANKNRNTFRANFLDDSMDTATALRAAEASQGYVVQNGRTFERQGDKLVEIDPDKASDYRNEKAWGRDPGQKFKDGYLKAVVEAGKGEGKTDSPDTKPDSPSSGKRGHGSEPSGVDEATSSVKPFKPTEEEFDISGLSERQQELVKGTGVIFSTKGMTDDNAAEHFERFKTIR